MTKHEQSEAIQKLRETFKPGDTVYTVLRHVSRSGMTRVISVHAKPGEDDWSYMVAKALDWRLRDAGVYVQGCGMDMGYHVAYELSHALYPDGFGCIGEGCPSNDHSNGDRDYTPNTSTARTANGKDLEEHEAKGNRSHWHHDGGYALRHRWV